MSFRARLIHELTVERTPRDQDTPDEYGQPTAGEPDETPVRGLVQPKSAREIANTQSAGAEISDHTIFLAPMDLDPADAIVHGSRRFAITGIRSFEFGRSPHLEVDARLVRSDVLAEVGS